MTLVQMDNAYRAARGDFYANGGTDAAATTPDRLEPLRAALLSAAARRQAIPDPAAPTWGKELADYVQAVVDAEKVARRLTWR